MEIHSRSPFALLLAGYDRYRRTALAPDALTRVAKKYSKQPSALLPDIVKKYSDWQLPAAVSVAYLQKLVMLYSVPDIYYNLIPELACQTQVSGGPGLNTNSYDPRQDPASDEFDPSYSLQTGFLLLSTYSGRPLDNLAKARSLLPGLDVKSVPAPLRTTKSIAISTSISSNTSKNVNNTSMGSMDADADALPRFLDDIVSLSSLANQVALSGAERKTQPSGADVVSGPPLSLLKQFMNNRCRVRVLIRRSKGVRGVLVGYLVAFDNHWNLLLKDVDEEFTPLSSRRPFPYDKFARNLPSGRDCSSSIEKYKNTNSTGIVKGIGTTKCVSVIRRHLQQLLVRGDNVIMVCAADGRSPGSAG